MRGGALAGALDRCEASGPLGSCIAATRPHLERLHLAQRAEVLHADVCPPGSPAVWLDRMHPAAPFSLCARTGVNLVDNELWNLGYWRTCREVAELLGRLGTPGCRVLDVGANIGSCTVMLARLGYQVTAFEPLPGNLAHLEASLRLNGLADGARAPGGGSVTLNRMALGDSVRQSRIVEARGNAGMSVLRRFGEHCDNVYFKCDDKWEIDVGLLDEYWQSDEDICFAKVDIEGSELRFLRGASALLRSRRIKVLHMEHWLPHLQAQGEEPMAMLWFLYAHRYEIFAPAWWFGEYPPGEGNDWVRLPPDQFDFLRNRWGDILAVAT